jgi:beta propeller repeat protein
MTANTLIITLNTTTVDAKYFGIIHQITDNSTKQRQPSIYGDIIIWADDRNHPTDHLNDFYIYNISTETEEILIENVFSLKPFIHGNIVAWKEGEFNTNRYSINVLSLQNRSIWSLGYNYTYKHNPVVFGSIICWIEATESETFVFIYNINNNTKNVIFKGNNNAMNGPTIFEKTIVWTERLDGDHDIFVYNMDNGTTRRLFNDSYDQNGPSLYGDRLVYSDHRNGNGDIFILYTKIS